MDELIERGSYYHTSFFQIFLQGRYNEDLSLLNTTDLGLFVHEYIHYIQNIGTTWGIYSALHEYKRISEVFQQLIDKNEINIVYTPDYSEEYKLMHEIWKLGEGQETFDDFVGKEIDLSKEIEIRSEHVDIQGNKYKKILLNFHLSDGNETEIHIGAKIIRECMAYMCQCLFDEHYTLNNAIPYKIIEYLCSARFKNIANDKKKIIAICYIALFSRRPAELLVDYLFEANNNPNIKYWELFDIFLSSKINNKGTTYSVEDFFNKMMDDFQNILKKLTRTDIPFLKISLDRARLTSHPAPLLAVINTDENPLTSKHIKSLVDYYGLPYIATTHGESAMGCLLPDNEHVAHDIIMMRALSIIIDYTTIHHIRHFCPAYMVECDGSAKDDNECTYKPWEGNKCFFTEALSLFGIDTSKFHFA